MAEARRVIPDIDFNGKSAKKSLDGLTEQIEYDDVASGASDTLSIKVFNISIHAPARGATFAVGRICSNCGDFNPRSREGSDGGAMPPKIIWGKFQSTLPRGERQGAGNTGEYYIKISIHAPARGATCGR